MLKTCFLSVLGLAGAFVAPHRAAYAQLSDQISSIQGETFVSDAQIRYFNGANCAAPEETSFEIRLDQSNTSSEVILWIGSAGAECNREAQREVTAAVCAPIREAAPIPVATDFLVKGLFLQDLLDPATGGNPIATCDSSGLQGTEYKIFVFREAPAGDVAPEQYGIASFRIDVAPPNPPRVDTTPQQGQNFQISWSEPDPPDDIGLWAFHSSSEPDPTTAQPLEITAPSPARAATLAAHELGITEGETAYVFVSALDQAFVSNPQDANESPLSDAVEVTNVGTADGGMDAGMEDGGMDAGMEDAGTDTSSGGRCSASPMHPSSLASWGAGLAALLVWGRRRHLR